MGMTITIGNGWVATLDDLVQQLPATGLAANELAALRESQARTAAIIQAVIDYETACRIVTMKSLGEADCGGATDAEKQERNDAYERLLKVMTDATAGQQLLKKYREAVKFRQSVDELRREEGSSVEIICDNPDFGGSQHAITVHSDWTHYKEERFEGDTLQEALDKALKEKADHKLKQGE